MRRRSRTNTAGQALPRAAPGQPAGHRLADSAGSGSRSRRLPLPRTVISPGRQLDVTQVQRRDLSGAQAQPRQQHQDREVPAADGAVRSQLSISRARSAALTARGSAASCQPAADGTAPASGTVICPSR